MMKDVFFKNEKQTIDEKYESVTAKAILNCYSVKVNLSKLIRPDNFY